MIKEDFRDVTRIIFEERDTESRKLKFKRLISIRNPRKIERLISTFDFHPWPNDQRPGCYHVLRVRFHTVSRDFEVDFCPICFGPGPMPRQFYAEFHRIYRKRKILLGIFAVGAILALLAVWWLRHQ